VNKVSSAVGVNYSEIYGTGCFRSNVSQEARYRFIITNDGLILTNKHVVSDSSAAYTVVLSDGKSYDAKIQSVDPFQDLAVIKMMQKFPGR